MKKESQTVKTIGYRLVTLLTEQGRKQKELADFLNVKPNVVSNYFTGERTPNIDQIVKIAEFFHTTPNYILGVTASQSTDDNLQTMCEYTGLSDRAIQTLHELSERSKGNAVKAEYQPQIAQYQNIIDNQDAELTKLYSTEAFSEDIIDKFEKLIIESKKESERLLDFYLCKNKSEATIELATINELLSKSDIEKLIEYVYLYLHTDIEVPDIEFFGLVEDNRLSDNAIDVVIPMDKPLFDASLLAVIRSIFEEWKDKTVSRIPEMKIYKPESEQNG